MSIVKAAILPHSPLLIPEIGRVNHVFLKQTTVAYEKIKQDLESEKIDTLIIITPHGPEEEIFTINAAPELSITFQDFGFIPPKTFFQGDLLLADQLKNQLPNNLPVQLKSEAILDYGSGIPAYLLKYPEKVFKLVTITPPQNATLTICYEFGQALKKIIESSEKKIAVISSSDLSHRLQKKSPGGYSPKGSKFDNKLIEHLNEPLTAANNISKMDSKLIIEAGECGLKPIMTILGVLEGIILETKVLAYQTDFGIGYLSLDFQLIENSIYASGRK